MAIGVLISVGAFLAWKGIASPNRFSSFESGVVDENAPDLMTVSEQDDPLPASWNTFVENEHNEVAKIGLLIESAKDSWQQSGIDVLDEAWGSLTDPNVRNVILRSVLIEAVQREGHAAIFDRVMSLRGEVRDWTLREIVESWLRDDPHQTIETLSSVESQRVRRGLQRVAATEWAKLDPDELLNSLDQLPQNVRWIGEQEAMLTIARTAPLDALRFLEDPFNVMESSHESLLAQEIANSWSEVDLGAALTWATTQEFTKRQTQFDVVSVVLRKLARTNPQGAMERIQQHFDGELIAKGLKLVVIDEVASINSESAIELLDQVNICCPFPNRQTIAARS